MLESHIRTQHRLFPIKQNDCANHKILFSYFNRIGNLGNGKLCFLSIKYNDEASITFLFVHHIRMPKYFDKLTKPMSKNHFNILFWKTFKYYVEYCGLKYENSSLPATITLSIRHVWIIHAIFFPNFPFLYTIFRYQRWVSNKFEKLKPYSSRYMSWSIVRCGRLCTLDIIEKWKWIFITTFSALCTYQT